MQELKLFSEIQLQNELVKCKLCNGVQFEQLDTISIIHGHTRNGKQIIRHYRCRHCLAFYGKLQS